MHLLCGARSDNVIVPTGAGSNILGCDLGFNELLRAGEIDACPRLFCVQPLQCSPIATAIQQEMQTVDGLQRPPEWNQPNKTIAEGTSIMLPVRLAECVDAVKRSGGGAVRITGKLRTAVRLLPLFVKC